MIEEFKDLPDALFRVAGPNFWSNTYTVKMTVKFTVTYWQFWLPVRL